MQKKRSPRRSASEWSEIVAGWEASGETAARYAAHCGLNAASLYVWRSRLSKGVQQRAPRSRSSRRKGDFTEVMVRAPASAPSSMEVVARSGHRICVRGAIDPATLRTLLQVLESC